MLRIIRTTDMENRNAKRPSNISALSIRWAINVDNSRKNDAHNTIRMLKAYRAVTNWRRVMGSVNAKLLQ